METVFILMGTNLGDCQANLTRATGQIQALAGRVLQSSPVYRTAAWGKTDQPDFYNQVLEITTSLTPSALLQALLEIEKEMGRERREKWGERVIDIDILFFGQRVQQTAELILPHPQIPFRRFTLRPLADIAPELVHPVYNKTILQLLEECPDTLPVDEL